MCGPLLQEPLAAHRPSVQGQSCEQGRRERKLSGCFLPLPQGRGRGPSAAGHYPDWRRVTAPQSGQLRANATTFPAPRLGHVQISPLLCAPHREPLTRPSQPRAAEAPSQLKPSRKPAHDSADASLSPGEGSPGNAATPRPHGWGHLALSERQLVRPTRPAPGSPWNGPPRAPSAPGARLQMRSSPARPETCADSRRSWTQRPHCSSLALGTASLSSHSLSSS